MHNKVDRISLTVKDQGLYSTVSYWPNPAAFHAGRAVFDLYIASVFEPARLEELLTWAFENGYGADASSGKGVISVLPGIKMMELSVSQVTRYMALGPFVLDSDMIPEDLLSDIFIRRGNLGGGFGSSVNPYKKTVVLYDEGATFMCNEGTMVVGRLIENIHTDQRICQSGFCPIIPLPQGDYV